MIPAMLAVAADSLAMRLVGSVLALALVFGVVASAWRPAADFLRLQEYTFDKVLRHRLLLDIRPRSATITAILATIMLFLLGYALSGSLLGAVLGGALGVAMPTVTMRYLARRRLDQLEQQIVGGVHMLASGVRAGLNLVQSMELVARDGPKPLSQEFAHLLREYEYGISLEQAMANAARRIGSNDYELLFAALRTHRERGGDLGVTLDRIADSIREIQRLENQVRTLTAQGRATARWLGAMPAVVLLLVYLMIDREGVTNLFVDPVGKLVILAVVVLNILGFLWIRRVMAVDI